MYREKQKWKTLKIASVKDLNIFAEKTDEKSREEKNGFGTVDLPVMREADRICCPMKK